MNPLKKYPQKNVFLMECHFKRQIYYSCCFISIIFKTIKFSKFSLRADLVSDSTKYMDIVPPSGQTAVDAALIAEIRPITTSKSAYQDWKPSYKVFLKCVSYGFLMSCMLFFHYGITSKHYNTAGKTSTSMTVKKIIKD